MTKKYKKYDETKTYKKYDEVTPYWVREKPYGTVWLVCENHITEIPSFECTPLDPSEYYHHIASFGTLACAIGECDVVWREVNPT